MNFDIRIDPRPDNKTLAPLWRAVWDRQPPANLPDILARSLVHVVAYEGAAAIGFVYVAWDGGEHGFLLSPCVRPDRRGQGLGQRLVRTAVEAAAERSAKWIHVDFELGLARFYARCGFEPTAAGLISLR